MISRKLVEQIEAHADRLALEACQRVAVDERTPSYARLPNAELEHAVHEVFKNLGIWLTSRSDAAVENRYLKIGVRRRNSGIPMKEVLCAFGIVKETLFRFIRSAMLANPGDAQFESELVLSLSEFFDSAVYGMALGYEYATQAGEIPAEAPKLRPVYVKRTKEFCVDDAEWDPTSRSGAIGEVSG